MKDSSPIVISLENVSHRYESFEKGETLKDLLRDFFARKTQTVNSLREISLEVAKGEILGLLGPNGAGKTTTLKVLSGLLPPSSGTVHVLGTNPYKKEKSFLKKIGFVFGQKSQLNWDLPSYDTFDLLKAIYGLSQEVFEERLRYFTDLLHFRSKLRTPVRKLSLGERMKAEIICALLHMPEILFLDEPTIGLDIVSQRTIRDFIKKIVKENGVTVILTSHYIADIEALADKICILQEGCVTFLGPAAELSSQHSTDVTLTLTCKNAPLETLRRWGFKSETSDQWSLNVPHAQGVEILKILLNEVNVESVAMTPQSLEQTIYALFSSSQKMRSPHV